MTDCDEIGSVSRVNVSAHQRQRAHDVRLMIGEKRCLVINYGGAIPMSRTISGVAWKSDSAYAASISNERIQSDQRSAAADITTMDCGHQWVTCLATLDNGETYVQAVHVEVVGSL